MTTLQAVQFAAQIQIGCLIAGTYQTMRVERITSKNVFGYDEGYFQKKGKKVEVSMSFETLLNPHYNKGLSISK